jgi:hypothetical protein
MFKFDTSEFLQQNNKRQVKVNTLDDTRMTLCPNVPPSAAVNANVASQYGAQPSGVWTFYW